MNELELTGRARTHVVELTRAALRAALRSGRRLSWRCAMRRAATASTSSPRSSFRDFDTQLAIWNRKWSGERPLYDRQGALLDRARLSDDAQTVDAILCWSAMPGGSRHHWGSDVDVIDAAAVPPGYSVELLPAEYAPRWHFRAPVRMAGRKHAPLWFLSSVSHRSRRRESEPWHLSYAPVSQAGARVAEPVDAAPGARSKQIAGKPHVLARLPEIYTRFLLAIDAPGLTFSCARRSALRRSHDLASRKRTRHPALQSPAACGADARQHDVDLAVARLP